MLELPFNI